MIGFRVTFGIRVRVCVCAQSVGTWDFRLKCFGFVFVEVLGLVV